MTFGELKAKIRALVKVNVPTNAVTLQDKAIQEYVNGYNKAVSDVLGLIEQMKKSNDGNK